VKVLLASLLLLVPVRTPGHLGTRTPIRGTIEEAQGGPGGRAKPISGLGIVGADVIENDLKID
jgi:hypothetical protein